jgi:putative ABC transport system permease protein
VLLSFGLGLTLLVMLALIDVNLTRQFRAALPGVAPTFFFVDIPARDMDRFEAYLRERAPNGIVERVPQLRGRIIEIKDRPVAEVKAVEKIAWALEGDRGITYAATPPEGSTIAAGEWWPRDYSGKPLVSFARDVAEGLGLKVGDTITVNVLGRRIVATIANLREVRWQRLGINFVMVFSPNTFAGAPYTFLATLALPAGADAAQETAREIDIARKVAKDFPAISSVRVKEAVAAVDSIVHQLTLAIRAASGIALIASVLVLAGALGTSARARQRDSVILKTLGASRRMLLATFVIEYALLGCIAVVFALICGTSGAGFVVVGLMKFDFVIPYLTVISIAILALFATVALGLMGTWHILSQKPASYLRHS